MSISDLEMEELLAPLGQRDTMRREMIDKVLVIPESMDNWSLIDRAMEPHIQTGAQYEIETDNGTYQLGGVTKNPAALLFVNDIPATTCSKYYTPVSHHEVAEKAATAVDEAGLPVSPMRHIDLMGVHTDQVFRTEHGGALNSTVMSMNIYEKYVPPALIRAVGDKEGQKEAFDLSLAITNSYDFSMGINTLMHTIRLFCTNQLYGSFARAANANIYHTSFGDKEALLNRISPAVHQSLEGRANFWSTLSTHARTPVENNNLTQLMERATIRGYEAKILEETVKMKFHEPEGEVDAADHGVLIVEDKGTVDNQWDAINMLTDLANRVRRPKRAHDLRTKAIHWVASSGQ